MWREFEFNPRLWPTVAAVAGITLTLFLGSWQLSRGREKSELKTRIERLEREPAVSLSGAEIEARDVQWRRAQARGTFDPRYTVFIDNRVHHGIAGYEVIMPLKLAGSNRYVLVNRGWIAGSGDRTRPPAVKTPPTTVVVSGLAVVPSRRFLELSTKIAEGNVWQNLTLERYRQAVPITIQPFIIRQDSALDDGLVREWEAPDLGITMHYGYAFQWFALAATIFVFYLIVHVRRKRAD